MAPSVWLERKETKGRRCGEANKYPTRMKPCGVEEKTHRRRAVARRIHPTKEGEDAQRPATFWEERGPFRPRPLRGFPALCPSLGQALAGPPIYLGAWLNGGAAGECAPGLSSLPADTGPSLLLRLP
ncbi:hypothetical protein NDU88_001618 [Pleurodeles waltl]|uniref:Uncharacterized protein n=1 Tax=Pleurodeles waltl TaxID=8319 RepID=A0AAV7WP56_PLEWA|nr:hypothetical protein NDU88_001618 [Pleurodeles waltl]